MGGNLRDAGGDRLIQRMGAVVFGADAEIARWVGARIPGYVNTPQARALGVTKNGRIVAGVTFERYNGASIEVCIAAVSGGRWADRTTLRTLFAYPFLQLQCRVITALIAESNLRSLNLAAKMGFRPVALVPFAATDASTLIVLQMTREQCRWLDHGKRKQRAAAA